MRLLLRSHCTSCSCNLPEYLLFLQILRYGLVIVFNVTMWGCYVNSLKALSSLQATVTNFATNFLTSGLAGYFLFEEALSFQVNQRVLLLWCLKT